MKKVKEYYICDRCKKELDKDELKKIGDIYNAYTYELCEQCENDYYSYDIHMKAIYENAKALTEGHNFGKYMYQEDKDGQPTR